MSVLFLIKQAEDRKGKMDVDPAIAGMLGLSAGSFGLKISEMRDKEKLGNMKDPVLLKELKDLYVNKLKGMSDRKLTKYMNNTPDVFKRALIRMALEEGPKVEKMNMDDYSKKYNKLKEGLKFKRYGSYGALGAAAALGAYRLLVPRDEKYINASEEERLKHRPELAAAALGSVAAQIAVPVTAIRGMLGKDIDKEIKFYGHIGIPSLAAIVISEKNKKRIEKKYKKK